MTEEGTWLAETCGPVTVVVNSMLPYIGCCMVADVSIGGVGSSRVTDSNLGEDSTSKVSSDGFLLRGLGIKLLLLGEC